MAKGSFPSLSVDLSDNNKDKKKTDKKINNKINNKNNKNNKRVYSPKKYQWNNKAGTGWMRGKDGKWYQYKDHKKTGVSKNNLTLGSGIAKFISKKVKNLQSDMATNSKTRRKAIIGKGTESNPEFRVDSRGRIKKRLGFKPKTTVAKGDGGGKVTDKPNKKVDWTPTGGEVARSKAGPGYVSTEDKKSTNTNKVKISTNQETTPPSKSKKEVTPKGPTNEEKIAKLKRRIKRGGMMMQRGQLKRRLQKQIRDLQKDTTSTKDSINKRKKVGFDLNNNQYTV